MTARVYFSTPDPRGGQPLGWRNTTVQDPPFDELRVPLMGLDGSIKQLVFRLVSVEHGVAVYL